MVFISHYALCACFQSLLTAQVEAAEALRPPLPLRQRALPLVTEGLHWTADTATTPAVCA